MCEYFDTTQGRNILGTYVIHLQNKTQALEADFDELPHPSLTRTRHPVYGNSVFSEGQGVYRTNRANDDITEVQHQPPISPSPERHSIPNDRGGSPVVTPIQPPIYTPHHTSEREPRRRRRPLSVIVHQSSEEDEDDSQSPPEVNYKSGPRIRSLSPTTRYVTGSSQLGQVEDYIIKCICGSREDDGNTVYCDLCHTWQHTGCYYIDKHGNLPTKEELEVIDHFCVRCRPRSVNAKDVIEGVIERQQTRREDLESSTTHDGPVKGQVSFEMGDEDQEHEGWAEESNSLSPIITRRGSAPTNVDSRLESFCSYRDSRGVLHRGLKPQYHVPHLVNGVPAEPPSFQYRRDSSGNLYQVPYVPPAGHKPPQLEDLPATVEEQRKAGTSSYWSVAEQRDYYYYIRYLGTDWKAMSTKLTTKTPQMVTIPTSNRVTESTDWISRSRISTAASPRTVNLKSN